MWRAFFLAVGAYCCLVGVECLLIDKAVLAGQKERPGVLGPFNARPVASRDIVPADWAPWSLLSAGAVTILYSFTLPRKTKE